MLIVQAEATGTLVKFIADNGSLVTPGQVSPSLHFSLPRCGIVLFCISVLAAART
jgi:hypothetical protein